MSSGISGFVTVCVIVVFVLLLPQASVSTHCRRLTLSLRVVWPGLAVA